MVGVAREIHHPSLDARFDVPEFYQPFAGIGRAGARSLMMSIRCDDPCPDPALVRQRLTTVHPAIRVHQVGSLDAVYFEQLARPRAAAALGFTFAAIATLAAAGGLFSVLSYAVGRRRREFGSAPRWARHLRGFAGRCFAKVRWWPLLVSRLARRPPPPSAGRWRRCSTG